MKKHFYALGRLKAGQMNKLEQKYSERLERMRHMGEILWFKFEAMKFRLADKTFYSPDFMVLNAKGELEAHEVKGFMQDDANVKIKVAANEYPIKFILVRWVQSQWQFTEVGE